MKKGKRNKIKIVLFIALVLLAGYAVKFFIHQPMDITKSYIQIRPFTESTYEMFLSDWKDKSENPNMYQSIYEGDVPPSEYMEDYIAINYYFKLKRYSFSDILDIEPVFHNFNNYKNAFMYAATSGVSTNLNEALFQTECSAFIVMYVGGLSKEEIEEAVRGAELSLLYTINGKTEKMACPINENTPVYFVEGVEDDEEE